MKLTFFPSSPLFSGISREELESLLDCLSASVKIYHTGETVFHAGDIITSAALVLAGSVNILKNDAWGNRKIIEHIDQGQVFGETYACLENEPLMVNAEACCDTRILFLAISKLATVCEKKCIFHTKLIHNLLSVLAKRNLMLTRKMDYITPKSIRERLLTYFSYESFRQQSLTIILSFNRQQLADYLSVDRSALSNELSKMKKDGLIRINRNTIELLSQPDSINPVTNIKHT